MRLTRPMFVGFVVLSAMAGQTMAAGHDLEKTTPPRSGSAAKHHTVLLEAESLADRGGWVVDTQSIDQMGSAYLLAHGLGVPVEDAAATIEVPTPGRYRVFVRTRNWVGPWNTSAAPGKFQVLVNGKPLPAAFGTEGTAWHWQEGGQVELSGKRVAIALHDLTGFEGRCDAILLTTDPALVPPNRDPGMAAWRRTISRLPETPPDAGSFDLVVVGGGMAGCCTAVSAARLGVSVALIQNRPVLGGNNSSEVRVGLSGKIHQQPSPRLGDLVDEIGPIGHHNYQEALKEPDSPRSREVLEAIRKDPRKKTHNAGPASNYEDDKKLRVVQAEKNIRLFLNTHVFRAEKEGPRIKAVVARSTLDGREFRVTGRWFVDCTGDGNLGFLAGADFRVGRESRAETGESLAPPQPDPMTMGTSVQWDSVEEGGPSPFPECPWALPFDEANCQRVTRGDWEWETGIGKDQIAEIEQIRDHAFRVIYGNWDYLKNRSTAKERFANRRLAWVAYIGGKRESRRLLGDVILQEQDLLQQKPYPDACVTTTWGIDLHYPDPKNSKQFPGQEFLTIAKTTPVKPYAIPFRCLYSRNVANLMMAGRDISVTHVALGTVRVQRTTGMMGEVVGMAALLCKRHNTDPRGVYQKHLDDLKKLMQRGGGREAVGSTAAASSAAAGPGDAVPKPIASSFRPPPEFAGDYGRFRSPLTFYNGEPVKTAADWQRRRQEILARWHGMMGPWPPVIEKPKVEILRTDRREDFLQHQIRFEWLPGQMTDGYLLVPAGEGVHPAVLVVYYEPETAIGLGKEHRDFAYQLTKRGFVTLSMGNRAGLDNKTYAVYYPSKEKTAIQPLSALAYTAANAYQVLAGRKEVDPQRIGVMGHSFGGKWAMFASCLYDKFACAVWSDPGIVFDEARESVNYWEPWYLGYEPGTWRTRGRITEANPRPGLDKRLVAEGFDLHELHALMAPRPFLVSGGSEDTPKRWQALNHTIKVNELLGYHGRVAMTNRPEHSPSAESNEQIYQFFLRFLKAPGGMPGIVRPSVR